MAPNAAHVFGAASTQSAPNSSGPAVMRRSLMRCPFVG